MINDKEILLRRILSELVNIPDSSVKEETQGSLLKKKTLLENELLIKLNFDDFCCYFNSSSFITFIEQNLEEDKTGNTIIDLFGQVEKTAQNELHQSVKLYWLKEWKDFYTLGNWLNSPDSLDFIEMYIRIEEELGIEINASYANSESYYGNTVGEFIKYLWFKLID